MKYLWILTTVFVPDIAGIFTIPQRLLSVIYFLTILQRYLNVISLLPVADVLNWRINSNHGTKDHWKSHTSSLLVFTDCCEFPLPCFLLAEHNVQFLSKLLAILT